MSAENRELVIPAPQGNSPAALMSFDDVARMAKVVVDGGLFNHLKSQSQALTLMLLAQAEGLHPIDAVRRFDIVNGRPAMKAAAMQAEFQNRGGRVEFHERSEKACDATFTAQDGTFVRVRWDMARATKARLTDKPGPWQTFPAAMLHARCVSEGIRAVAPGISLGIYTPEEVQDMGPINVGSSPAPIPTVEAPGMERSASVPPARPALPPARTVEAPTSQAQRDLGSPANSLPAKRQPTALEIEAISEFGETCSREGIDIMADGPDAQFSKAKMAAEVRRLLGLKPDAEVSSIGMWKAATAKLKASGAAPAPAKAAGQPMRRNTPEPASDDLADPLADDPTGVLSTPPAAASNGTGKDAEF
jgi:hypothetical protein